MPRRRRKDPSDKAVKAFMANGAPPATRTSVITGPTSRYSSPLSPMLLTPATGPGSR